MKVKWWNINLGKEELKSVLNVFSNKSFSLGPITKKCEIEIAKFLKIKNIILVNSGSQGMLLSLLALNIKPNDEVIIPNVAWISLLNAIKIIGAKPILVDVEENRPLMDPKKILKKITKKTRAIVPVHMNGRKANMIEIKKIAKKKKLWLLEDAAQAYGVKYGKKYLGSIGDLSVFSMSMTKTVTSGQGGFIATNNNFLAKKIRLMRNQGAVNVNKIYKWANFGFNFKITDLQSAIAIIQIKKFKKNSVRLIKNYKYFSEKLKDYKDYITPANINLSKKEIPVYNEFICKSRHKLQKFLAKKSIDCREFYPNLNKVKYIKLKKENFNNSEVYEKKSLYLPSGPDLPRSQLDYVIRNIKLFYEKRK